MAISKFTSDNENKKFVDTVDGPAVRTTSVGTGPGGSAKTTVTGNNGDAETFDSTADDIPASAVGLVTEALGWHWSVDLGTWARDYGSAYTNIPNTVSTPFTGARLYGKNGTNAVPITATATGELSTASAPAASAAITNVASSATSVQLLAANANRRRVLINNDSTGLLRVAYAAAATNTAYTVLISPGGYWEMPDPVYQGVISGIWSTANGSAVITELA